MWCFIDTIFFLLFVYPQKYGGVLKMLTILFHCQMLLYICFVLWAGILSFLYSFKFVQFFPDKKYQCLTVCTFNYESIHVLILYSLYSVLDGGLVMNIVWPITFAKLKKKYIKKIFFWNAFHGVLQKKNSFSCFFTFHVVRPFPW